MSHKIANRCILLIAVLALVLQPAAGAAAKRYDGVTAYDLIIAMNTLRVSYGFAPLIEDPIINAVAQSTAEIMAANQMTWHIGDASGRVAAAGYGGGAKVWATENFAVGTGYSIDEIMVVWADEAHMLPATMGAYCNVGAGVAEASNGMTYYVLQAAYVGGRACGDYNSPTGGSTLEPGGTTGGGTIQLIRPVKIATPDADGNIYHIVETGQSFWSIAVAYKVTIKDIEMWNNISSKQPLKVNQKLLIPGPNTKGYATPTPVGMILVSTPGPDGKIVHTVAAYQTLTTIALAYQVSVDTILALNGIQLDWPLQVGQTLVIHPSNITPSATPRPLTPIEKLTPAADGKFYHVVKSGETLSWISDYYGVKLADLMAWNGLTASSIIKVDQNLLLQVTPPARDTLTPTPLAETLTPTRAPRTATPSRTSAPTRTSTAFLSTAAETQVATASAVKLDPFLIAVLAIGGLGLVLVLFFRKK